MVVFGLTLLIWAPFTTRFLNPDPAELKDALKPEACVVATPKTASAVTSPLTRLTAAVSATPLSVAVLVAGSAVLVLDALSTLALTMLPPGGGIAASRTWLPLLAEPTPDCALQTPCVHVAGVAAGRISLIPRSASWMLTPKALPFACAPAGLEMVKWTGVRRANCAQAELAGLVEGSAWLNS